MKVLRNIFIILSLVFVLFLVACDTNTSKENQETNTNIVSKENIITISVGEAIRLKASNSACTWSSSNTSVATITEDGLLYGLSKGTTIITATLGDTYSEVKVSVEEQAKYLNFLVSGKQTIAIGEETKIVPTIEGTIESFTFTFATNDENVATVDGSGVVRGVNSGICTITIRAIGSTTLSKEVIIYVKDDDNEDNNINNVINNITYEVVGTFDLSMINEKTTSLVNKYKESIVGVSNYQTQVVSVGGNKSLV